MYNECEVPSSCPPVSPGEEQVVALRITPLDCVLQLQQLLTCDHSPRWALLSSAWNLTVERTQTLLEPGTQKSHLARLVSHDPLAQGKQSRAGLPLSCLGNELVFLQPDILDFCALLPTLVKDWTAPLRDLNYFSLTLSSQLGIIPKPM